jgi:hypothetical protein
MITFAAAEQEHDECMTCRKNISLFIWQIQNLLRSLQTEKINRPR